MNKSEVERSESLVCGECKEGVYVCDGCKEYFMPEHICYCDGHRHYCESCKKKENISNLTEVPRIVCLCGSTKFMQKFFEVGWDFTLRGYIVLSVGVCKHAEHHGAEALGKDVADRLDELHLRKIDMADEVFVINVGGYIGKSTFKEIQYANSQGKPITYLES